VPNVLYGRADDGEHGQEQSSEKGIIGDAGRSRSGADWVQYRCASTYFLRKPFSRRRRSVAARSVEFTDY